MLSLSHQLSLFYSHQHYSFYTNSQSFVTVAGRIDKFYKRYGKSSVKKDEKSN
ncbi:MAG: 50S ribosomal protein L31 [Candidatus Phytoplasma australasiaticum]|nr:50S ribosomal protein L31 [Candidatus Phytoplasma australasiaticum]